MKFVKFYYRIFGGIVKEQHPKGKEEKPTCLKSSIPR